MNVVFYSLLQKVLMQQRKRQTFGVPFDADEGEDIKWDEEFSSGDYDTDDVHSSVGSYCTDYSTTDDEEEGWSGGAVVVAPVQNLDTALEREKQLEDSDGSQTLSSEGKCCNL